jgi:tRNA (adenine57-N1/adenine58-N1)-methyltransferase
LPQVWEALGEGGFFGAVVPTANQVSDLLVGLEQQAFRDVEVCELLLRSYKPVAERLRPADRMVAHTGYLIFARRLAQAPPALAASQDQEEQNMKADAMGTEEETILAFDDESNQN